ncbi:TniQ family protein [Paenibacillus sp. IHBB 3054]|uniref:TniQ family protein n=1 Tax=Paenibacillus sp. IHBB 3054 TaxID=3425689 RepID=UPI003F6684C4
MQAIWRNEWIHEYETPWSIFGKFSLTNRIERNHLMKYLGNNEVKSIKNNLIGEKRRELFELSGFSEEMLNVMFDYNLVDFTKKTIDAITKPLINTNFPKQYWFFKHLRWCKECLSYGYHSWLHQFILLSHCPYHNCDLFDKCPGCENELPFTYSNKSLDTPFTCKCGNKLADFNNTMWSSWNIRLKVTNKSTIEWLSEETEPRQYSFHFIPEMCHIDLLTQASLPSATRYFEKTSSDLITLNEFNEYCYSNNFTRDLYSRNVKIYYTANRYLIKKYLTEHRKCIEQFAHLLREDNKEFPTICPLAYGYVNWRKYLLKKDHFYSINTRSNGTTLHGGNSGFEMMTSAIQSEVKKLLQTIVKQSKEKGINSNILLWIHDQWVSRFAILFFCNCLKYSELILEQQTKIRWLEILELTKSEFKIAFKIIESKEKIKIDVLYKNQNIADFNQHNRYKCPYTTLKKKRAISKMRSYTPMRIALNWPENNALKDYVDSFVKKHD